MVLRSSNLLTVLYHDIFDYPLTLKELEIWKSVKKIKSNKKTKSVDGYFFVKGKGGIVKKRLQKERYSKKKIQIAKKASRLISKIPSVLMVGVTGALAMNNASKNSDIDLLIITKRNTLWTTRMFVYLILFAFKQKVRSPLNKNEKDKLCLNMWLCETDLIWKINDRNIYTAHEIAQIVPLINKNKIYEKFLWKNKWILTFWSKAVKITKEPKKQGNQEQKKFLISLLAQAGSVLNFFSFQIQYFYMKPKITREVITSTRAIFHPTDWGKKVLTRLNSFG